MTPSFLRATRGSRTGRAVGVLLAAAVVAAAGCQTDAPSSLVYDFRYTLAVQAAEAEGRGSTTVPGLDGWLFFGPELRHVSVGRFWGDDALRVARARRPDAADPLPAILDFHRQLEAAGVELLLAPVPPKVLIFPDKILTAGPSIPIPVPRLDPAHAAFYQRLRAEGIDVLDLTQPFLGERFHPEDPLYCRHDTHWSGTGSVIAAREIAAAVRDRPWYANLARTAYRPRWFSTSITGDLTHDLDPAPPPEELRLRVITTGATPAPGAETTSDASPIVLLGDSHTLVFHVGGDLHAVGAGLPDQLAYELGHPVDLVGVRGSGATAARVNLMRRADANPAYWTGKRLVIWTFAARELTEADGWRTVPIQP